MPKRIVCRVLTGPTASGKTELSLAIAQKLHLDIICMDSMQVYRRMDIGTAKPDARERALVPHHMLDIREPSETFSVSEYVEEAEKLVKDLAGEGREALFVGGTGLYLQALIHPYGMGSVPANEERREELNALALSPGGKEALHRMLEALDPATAQRLPLNDIRRTIRAIEVTEATGIPFSAQKDRAEDSPFEWRVASTEMDRSLLNERINARVGRMIEAGLKEEVASLLAEGIPDSARSMCAIGYKEMIPCVRGEYSIDEAAEQIRMGSRRYAKRQMTLLRRVDGIRFIDALSASAEQAVIDILQKKRDD